mmetsp:Transcript_20518/g.25356  ORF Transcript_20518/g.25356 Transcript_20518/m.25356 type:complete len:234 (+) Transcript_20518:236-937(+)
MSLPDTEGDTQPSSGPIPLSRFTWSLLPVLLAPISSSRANSLNRPHSSDFNASPFRARHPPEDFTYQSFFFAKTSVILPNLAIWSSINAFIKGYFSARSMFHLPNICPGSVNFLKRLCATVNLFSRASLLVFHVPSSICFLKFSMNSIAVLTPSSFCMVSASFLHFSRICGSSQHLLILAPSSLAESCDKCTVPSPCPSFESFLAMSFWSAKTGVTSVGTPALREACVVPMPP